jgi:hypothetical protein
MPLTCGYPQCDSAFFRSRSALFNHYKKVHSTQSSINQSGTGKSSKTIKNIRKRKRKSDSEEESDDQNEELQRFEAVEEPIEYESIGEIIKGFNQKSSKN